MPEIEEHWCNKCNATTPHMMVKSLWRCNECLRKKLTDEKQRRQSAIIPRPVKKLDSKINAVCPCCGAGIRVTVEAVL